MHGISGTLVPAGFLEDVYPTLFETELNTARPAMPAVALSRWWRRVERQLGPVSTVRSVLDIAALPLLELLGYQIGFIEQRDQIAAGTLEAGGKRIAVIVVLPWSASPDDAWRHVHRGGRTVDVKWGVICSGRMLRVVDASRTWSRRSIVFDLGRVMDDEAALFAFWCLASLHGLSGFLDRVSDAADAHASKVCASLGDGVLESLNALVAALDVPRSVPRFEEAATFEQALTIVYRMLFLLFAEARAMVPTWHRVYRDAYSIEALLRRSGTSSRGRGLWETLQAISRLAHSGCRAGDLEVTPFNGRLFSPRHTPLAERVRISDAIVRKTVASLATGPSPAGRRRIAYADLGVEQLGAVYERVLEYEPERSNGTLTLARTSSERKATASFYTPRAITEFIVRRTLFPLVEGRTAEQILQLRVLDPAMGSGAFLVAACRFLARAAEKARIDSGEWSSGDVTREHRVELRRLVAQRCLYGVDRNPMAVQLARLSLWLTTLATDRALTFLDHHIATGDSLIGATLQDLARQPPGAHRAALPPPRTARLFEVETDAQMARQVLPDRFRLAEEAGDTPAAVRAKERTLDGLTAPGTPLHRWKGAADLWCAGWFWTDGALNPATYGDLLAAILQRSPSLSRTQSDGLLQRAEAIARALRPFHWQLEFPEAFFDRDGGCRVDGGFDAVLGNPPWEMLRADTGPAARRVEERAIQKDQLRFYRASGIYGLHGGGHVNQYQLFAERALQLLRPGGRLGLVLPAGVATDHGSAALRRTLFATLEIDRLFGFTNRDGIFPIHRDMRFVLLTGSKSGRTDALACRFGLRDTAWLDTLPDAASLDPPEARPIVLSRGVLERWDPGHLAVPELESARDLDILVHVVDTAPKLSDAAGWNVRFGRELNASDDRHHFVTRSDDASLLPIVEGKHVEPFRTLLDRCTTGVPAKTAARLLERRTTFGHPRIAYRDVASATNKLTLIAAILPENTVSTHTLFCSKRTLGTKSLYCLLALMNSVVANYLVRLQVTTHVTASLMARLPVPKPGWDSTELRALASLARELEQTGIDANRRAYTRLNAIVARLYQLTRDQYTHIVGTFPLLAPELRSDLVHSFDTETGSYRGHGV